MKKYILFLGLIVVFISCKKEVNPLYNNSSVTVINALETAPYLVVNFADSAIPFYLNQTGVSFGSGLEYGIPSGQNPIVVVSAGDTSSPVLAEKLNLNPKGIYSLYVFGPNGPKQATTILLQDTVPYISDSSADVRVINLSTISNQISLNLAGNPGMQTEFSNLSYEGISGFKTYSAIGSVGGSYNFEIRDQASDSLLTTYSWTYAVYRSNTIVIAGNDSTGINVFQVNNY